MYLKVCSEPLHTNQSSRKRVRVAAVQRSTLTLVA
jgi:hypothetical protein